MALVKPPARVAASRLDSTRRAPLARSMLAPLIAPAIAKVPPATMSTVPEGAPVSAVASVTEPAMVNKAPPPSTSIAAAVSMASVATDTSAPTLTSNSPVVSSRPWSARLASSTIMETPLGSRSTSVPPGSIVRPPPPRNMPPSVSVATTAPRPTFTVPAPIRKPNGFTGWSTVPKVSTRSTLPVAMAAAPAANVEGSAAQLKHLQRLARRVGCNASTAVGSISSAMPPTASVPEPPTVSMPCWPTVAPVVTASARGLGRYAASR